VTASDFKLIAAVIHDIRCRTDGVVTRAYIAVKFADALRLINTSFDADRFYKACGLTPEERAALKR